MKSDSGGSKTVLASQSEAILGGGDIDAAEAAAACMSLGLEERGRGRMSIKSGKLRRAFEPFRQRAPTSYARAAISAVGKEPSQILDFFLGSLISDTHFPHRRFLTPRYTGWRDPPPDDPESGTSSMVQVQDLSAVLLLPLINCYHL